LERTIEESEMAKSLGKNSLELIAERFGVLSDPLRLELLHTLADRERTVTELVEACGSTQANVSKHLQVLRRAGVVSRRKEGLHAYYQIADPSIFELCDLVCGRMAEQLRASIAAIEGPDLEPEGGAGS
jgi:DNA-binding transcriptional ArsR family regulator